MRFFRDWWREDRRGILATWVAVAFILLVTTVPPVRDGIIGAMDAFGLWAIETFGL